jgi:ribosome-associated protein
MEPVDGMVVTPGGRQVAAAAVTWWATRSGGPGGQHANTSDTAVTVAIDVVACALPSHVTERVVATAGTTITASSAGSRSQWRNRQLAWAAAMSKLDAAAAPPAAPRTATRPSRGARERRLAAKHRDAARKADRRRPSSDD